LFDPFVQTAETSRMQARQGPDWITQWLMAHYALSQGLIHGDVQQEERRKKKKERKFEVRQRKKEQKRTRKALHRHGLAVELGSPEYCAILVAVNSCLQLLLYSPLAVLFIDVLSGGDGSSHGDVRVFFWDVIQSVLIFLGVPFVLGVLIRSGLLWLVGRSWFEKTFVPRFSPLALLGLFSSIFFVTLLFASYFRWGSQSRLAIFMTFLCFCFSSFFLFLCSEIRRTDKKKEKKKRRLGSRPITSTPTEIGEESWRGL